MNFHYDQRPMKQTRRHNRLLLVLALLGMTSLLLVRGTLPSVTAAGSGDFTPHPTTPSFGAGDSRIRCATRVT